VVPAIGFAAGLERLLIASDVAAAETRVDAFVALLGATATEPGLVLGRDLRASGVRTEVDTRGTSLKSQLRRAGTLEARLVLILGDGELAQGVVQLKDFAAGTQETIARDRVVEVATERLRTPAGSAKEQA
jgi:histidyl-tRNA synthetase